MSISRTKCIKFTVTNVILIMVLSMATACEDALDNALDEEMSELDIEAESSALLDLGFTVFYADTGYGGFAAHAYEGQSYPDLYTLDNKASSLRSYTDYITCLYSEKYFQGSCICFAPDARVPDLNAYGWDNLTSSIKLVTSKPNECPPVNP